MAEKEKRFYIKRTVLVAMVERLQRSEPGSVEEIQNTFYDKIYGHIMRRTEKDKKATIIILENVFSEIFASINTLRKPEAFVSWCNRITENKITAYYRQERRRLKTEQEYQKKHYEGISDTKMDQASICEALRYLSKKQAEVTKLHVLDGIPVQEIAELLQIPEGTVKSRLYYGRQKLIEMREKNDTKGE